MEKDKLDDTQIYPTPTSPMQSNNLNNDWQGNNFNNQPLGTSHSTKDSNKSKKIVAIFVTLAIVATAVIATLFLTGIIGERRVEVGDYTVIINENNWASSIGQDGNTLVLMNKESDLSGIGILPYTKDITYDLLDQGGSMKSLVEQIDNVQFESQSKQTIGETRCIVVNIKYKKVSYANDKAIKAFCEGKDGTMFLIEVEGANQTELNSNLSVGVDIINTAEHR